MRGPAAGRAGHGLPAAGGGCLGGCPLPGTFSPDGTEFYWFAKVDPDEEDYRTFRVERSAAGWSEPALLALGDSSASNMYPVISPDGSHLVFTSYRAVDGGTRNANLWVARRSGSEWEEPSLMRGASTLANYDAAPWFGPDGELRFSSTSPDWSETWTRSAPRPGDSFGHWVEDTFWDGLAWPRATHHFWSGIVNGSGTFAVLELA